MTCKHIQGTDPVKIILKELSEADGQDIFEMIFEIGSDWASNLAEIDNGICRYWIKG